jgi:outer membrane lipoprotein SlyB
MAAAGGAAIGGVIGKGIEKAADWYKGKKEQQALARHKQQGVAEGDNMSTFVEDRELAEMLKYAGVPIKEGVLKDDTRNTWDHLLDRFRHEVEQFRQGSDLDSDLYDALFDYYDQHGAMPYRVRNAKDGTANQWISSRLADDLGIDEGVLGTVGGAALGGMLGGPVGAAVGSTAGQEMTKGGSGLIEGSCNMTAEGSYCPEHGLMECGSMEEDGGAVGMPYSMGEGTDDPINSNSAMTGSYYEGKETKSQEGDALLARIKSLALLR